MYNLCAHPQDQPFLLESILILWEGKILKFYYSYLSHRITKLSKANIYDFSVWLRTCTNPLDINVFQSNTGKMF